MIVPPYAVKLLNPLSDTSISNLGLCEGPFFDFNLNFNQNESYQSNLHLKIQRTSSDTYFKKHDINTALVNSENTNLKDEIKYSFYNELKKIWNLK